MFLQPTLITGGQWNITMQNIQRALTINFKILLFTVRDYAKFRIRRLKNV